MPQRLKAALFALNAVCAISAADAQPDVTTDYPNRPVRIVVAGEAGGGIDVVARVLSSPLKDKLGQPFVIENRGGAGGNLGASIVFNAAPDGYTLLGSALAPVTINHLLYRKLSFDPSAFEYLAIMSRIPNLLVVRKDFPSNSVADLLGHLKQNPGKVNYGSNGLGTSGHLTAELFMRVTGTNLFHVPYKSTSPLLNDLLGNRLDVAFAQASAVFSHHTAGTVKVLAAATNERLDFMPDVPTLAEAGVPGINLQTWNALSAPPKTPAAIVAKLNAAVTDAMNRPEVKGLYSKLFLLPGEGNPAEVRKFITEDGARWADIIRLVGLKPE
jgi:tripartite-type tricarboxylate transporter receptor subunit TctC